MKNQSTINIKKVYKTAIRSYYTGLIHMAFDNRDDLTDDQFGAVVQLASYMLVSAIGSIDEATPKMLRDMATLNDGGFYTDIEQADVHNDAEFEAAVNKMLDTMESMKDEPIYSPSGPEADACRNS